MASSGLPQQSRVVSTEMARPPKSKIFTDSFFIEKVCWPLPEIMDQSCTRCTVGRNCVRRTRNTILGRRNQKLKWLEREIKYFNGVKLECLLCISRWQPLLRAGVCPLAGLQAHSCQILWLFRNIHKSGFSCKLFHFLSVGKKRFFKKKAPCYPVGNYRGNLISDIYCGQERISLSFLFLTRIQKNGLMANWDFVTE